MKTNNPIFNFSNSALTEKGITSSTFSARYDGSRPAGQFSIFNSSRGAAFLLAMLIIAAISTIALGVGRLMVAELRISGSLQESNAAYHAAEAGIEDGLLRLRYDPDYESTAGGTEQTTNPEIYNLTNPINPKPLTSENYYQLRVYNKLDKVGDFDLTSGVKDNSPLILRDEFFETTLSSNVSEVLIRFKLEGAASTAADPAYLLEMILLKRGNLTSFSDVDRKFCPIKSDGSVSTVTVNNNPTNNSNCVVRLAGGNNYYELTLTGLSGLNGVSKIRIKPWRTNVRINMKPTGGLISGENAIVESTGFLGRTQRKLRAKINRATGQVQELFDFVIFEGEGS